MILLPGNATLRAAASSTKAFFRTLTAQPAKARISRGKGGSRFKMKVLDSIHEDGAKLVEISAKDAQALRADEWGLRMVPEQFYQPAVQFYQVESRVKSATTATASARKVIVKVTSAADGSAIPGANVVAFTNFATREGDGGVTSKSGTVTLSLPSGIPVLDRLYVYPANSFWGSLQIKLNLASTINVPLTPIDLALPRIAFDSSPHSGEPDDGCTNGVKVGVVDTGIALKHPDLKVLGGECTVPGEPANSYGPLGGDHGSHCAGIIAARGTPPKGIRGIAPGTALYSYRVFPKATPQDPEPAQHRITRLPRPSIAGPRKGAICSISVWAAGNPDPATEAAIQDARKRRMRCHRRRRER